MRGCLLAAAIMLLAGCGGGGGAYKTTTRSIVGTWTVQTIGRDGLVAVNCPGTLRISTLRTETCGPNDTVTFTDGGAYIATDSTTKSRATGSWSMDGCDLSIRTTSGKQICGTLTYRSDNVASFRPMSDPDAVGDYAVWVRQ